MGLTTLPCRFRRLYSAGMANQQPLLFVPVGWNDARPFGMDPRERSLRLATNAGFECSERIEEGRALLVASMRFAWDPAWLKILKVEPGTILTLDGEPVMAHVTAEFEPAPDRFGP